VLVNRVCTQCFDGFADPLVQSPSLMLQKAIADYLLHKNVVKPIRCFWKNTYLVDVA